MPATPPATIEVIDLGQLAYQPAWDLQARHHAQVLASRDAGAPLVGRLLLVEHTPPVITYTRRPASLNHLLATRDRLSALGIQLIETDRGGDITYHGPGQLVVYPIIDLNTLGMGLHDYMRALETAVISALATLGVAADREPGATGVWVPAPAATPPDSPPSKICAMGVRVKRWVTMHGLALNVNPDLSHFDLIVPCGLAGRRVTSLRALLGRETPAMRDVSTILVRALRLALAPTIPTSGRAEPLR